MNVYRTNAAIAGALFLAAIVASLLGGSLIDAVTSAPGYLAAAAGQKNQLITGVLLELVNAIAVVGIAVLLFPILKQYSETLALGYLGLRIIEAVFCSAIVISPLSLLRLSQEYVKAEALQAAYFQTAGALSLAERASIVGLLVPVFFSLGALVFYFLLYQSRLLPRFIPAWGLVAAVLILALNLLSLVFEISLGVGLVFALPMILNEIFLGIWLMVKGFNPPATVSGAAIQA